LIEVHVFVVKQTLPHYIDRKIFNFVFSSSQSCHISRLNLVQDGTSNPGYKDQTKSRKSSSFTNQKGSSDFINIFTNFIRDAILSNLEIVDEWPTLTLSIVDDESFCLLNASLLGFALHLIKWFLNAHVPSKYLIKSPQ